MFSGIQLLPYQYAHFVYVNFNVSCLLMNEQYFVYLWTNWKKYLHILIALLLFQQYCNYRGFPGGSDGKESACNAGDPGSIYWGKIPWRREWQPTLVFLPGEFRGQRSLVSFSPWGGKESDTTEWLTFILTIGFISHISFFLVAAFKLHL